MRKVSTLLIDSNRLCREGLAKLLEDSPYEVTAQAATPDEAIEIVGAGPQPELCLIAYAVGDKHEIERVSRLRDIAKQTRIVVLSTLRNARLLAQSLEMGVDAFLLKDMSAEALEQALGLVMTGEKVMPMQLASLLINGKIDPVELPATGRKFRGLSQREIQILRCLVNGSANKVIANQLDITEGTVKVHLKGILKKTNMANRTQAAVWAIKYGLTGDILEATGT